MDDIKKRLDDESRQSKESDDYHRALVNSFQIILLESGRNFSVDDLATFIDQINALKGWNVPRTASEWVALAHSEISEAYEEYRNGHPPDEIYYSSDGHKPEGQAIEYADALIRILHWFARHGLKPSDALQMKLSYNLTRPYRHGGKLA